MIVDDLLIRLKEIKETMDYESTESGLDLLASLIDELEEKT